MNERNEPSFCDFDGGHAGMVIAYTPKIMADTALKISCMLFDFHPHISTVHMAAIKPIVPHTRIGGKSFTILNPFCSSMVYETVLLSAMVVVENI